MSKDYIPSRDAELVGWSNNFEQIVAAAPVALGLTVAQAAAYTAANADWQAAYTAGTDPSTRNVGTVAQKREKRAAIVALARQYNAIIQATPSVTDQQKLDLGLHVKDAEPSPSHAPTFAPGVVVLSVFNRTARTRLFDPANPTKRGKPDNCAGAQVFSYVGEEPPADLSAWTSEGNTSRTALDITFPTSVAPGAKIWITARWFGPRFQNGPAATPVMTNLPGGSAQAAA